MHRHDCRVTDTTYTGTCDSIPRSLLEQPPPYPSSNTSESSEICRGWNIVFLEFRLGFASKVVHTPDVPAKVAYLSLRTPTALSTTWSQSWTPGVRVGVERGFTFEPVRGSSVDTGEHFIPKFVKSVTFKITNILGFCLKRFFSFHSTHPRRLFTSWEQDKYSL